MRGLIGFLKVMTRLDSSAGRVGSWKIESLLVYLGPQVVKRDLSGSREAWGLSRDRVYSRSTRERVDGGLISHNTREARWNRRANHSGRLKCHGTRSPAKFWGWWTVEQVKLSFGGCIRCVPRHRIRGSSVPNSWSWCASICRWH